MNTFRIGNDDINEIKITGVNARSYHAQITYIKGNWTLIDLVGDQSMKINNEKIVRDEYILQKYDVINIGTHSIHWADYLIERDQTPILKDLFTFHGRINLVNFRVLNLVFFGLAICIFFLPGVIVSFLLKSKSRFFALVETYENWIQALAPFVYAICYSILIFVFIIVLIKRTRDAGKSLWKLFIPFYNLTFLYFEESK